MKVDDNNQRLNAIMSRHGLTSKRVSELLSVHHQYARSMKCGGRPISSVMVRLLEFKLGDRKASSPETLDEFCEILDLDDRRQELLAYELGAKEPGGY